MIYLKVRQAGQAVNHKRVDRLYAEARLQVHRRQRKKIPVADRQPLVRPDRANRCGRRTSSSTAPPKGGCSSASDLPGFFGPNVTGEWPLRG